MVRREAILFILANIGSILGQFSTPDKRDKSELLRYRMGVQELDNSTAVRTKVNKWVQAWEPSSVKSERIRQSIPLPDKDDKSKLLENLRIMLTPSTKQKKHQVSIQSNWDDEYSNREQNTDWIVNSTTEQKTEVLWEDPTTTRIKTLQPVTSNLTMKENENDTCDWRGREPQEPQRTGLDALQQLKKKQESELNIENVGQKLNNIWKCIRTKYWISYEKIKKKVCSWFGKKNQELLQTSTNQPGGPTDTEDLITTTEPLTTTTELTTWRTKRRRPSTTDTTTSTTVTTTTTTTTTRRTRRRRTRTTPH